LRAEPGVLVVDQPAGLDACRTSREAEAWCAKNNHGREGLFRWTTPAGPQFGFLLTEVDVVLLAARPNGKLACIRMENVKAGNGSAADARKQNRVAIDALARPSVRLLCRPKNAGRNTYEDIRPRLDAASGAPEAATVGPSGDPRYDVALPLSAGDITEVARRLGNGSALAT
jgi:hypothetical protein